MELPQSGCGLTAELQPIHLPHSLGQLNQSHVVAVVHILQELLDLLLHLANPGLHCRNTEKFTEVKIKSVKLRAPQTFRHSTRAFICGSSTKIA